MAKKRGAKRGLTASMFYDDVVLTLGELSDFTAYVDVPSKEVIQRVLDDRGLDENFYGVSETRQDRKSVLVLRIEWAFRNQRRKHRKDRRTNIYCKQGSKSGMWSLTEVGVEQARKLAWKKKKLSDGGGSGGGNLVTVAPDSVAESAEDVVPLDVAGSNATAQYLSDNWDTVYETLHRNLSIKLPKSREYGLIEDHVMSFVTQSIARDSLARYIETGTLTMAKMTLFAWRAAISQFKCWGQEPSCRALRGAHTGTEVMNWEAGENGEESEQREALVFCLPGGSYDSLMSSMNAPFWHLSLGNMADPEECMADIECAEKFLPKIEQVLRDSTSSEEHGNQLIHLLQGIYEDRGPTEMAHEMGMNRSTVSNRVQRLKHTLSRAKDRGEFNEYLSG